MIYKNLGICPVCKKTRSANNHSKCSRILQKEYFDNVDKAVSKKDKK